MEKLGINLGYLIVQILNFGILFVVLKGWVYEPLLGMMKKRREAIAQGLEDARIAAEARANAELKAAGIINQAELKAAEILITASQHSDAVRHDAQSKAAADINKMREAAQQETQEERNRILADLRGQVATLAIAATQKLIGESLDEARQHVLVNQFFSGVKAGKIVVLDGQTVEGSAVEITSALPLTEDEQAAVRKEMLGKLGGNPEITYQVDPTILGGLVVRVGDRVIDGSVFSQLQVLRQTLQ